MNILIKLLLLAVAVNFYAAAAEAQTSVFSYQGKLIDGGVPANGSYDMRFRLFDAVTVGSQIGSDAAVNGVQAAGGIFAVEVDFGTPPFSGADRFLEIAISPAGQNNFTTLAPRQRLNSSPYAMKSLNAETSVNSLSLGGTAANQFVQTADPRMSDARVPLPGSGSYIQNTATTQSGANFNVGGTGTASVFNAGTQFNLGGSRILSSPGTNNFFAGVNAGVSNTFGSNNSFFGTNAGQANTTGQQNAFFGANAGNTNTSGFRNSFFGDGAGQSTATGAENTFFGAGAGQFNTASSNAFFGAFAGNATTTGNSNAFFGTNAGLANTTGFSNAFFGHRAGAANTTAGNNAFFGVSAGALNTTGFSNVFVGSNSGSQNTTGQQNAFVGEGAGRSNTTASDNAFVGARAGFANTTGFQNAFVGAFAGNANTTGLGNAFLGYSAGQFNTSGNNNIFIGSSAGNPSAATQVSNSIAIGNNVTVPTSNSIVLGTSSHSTRIPGHLMMGGGAPQGGGPGTNFVAQSFSNLGFAGIFTNQLVLDNNGLNNVLPSQVHICIRTTSIGGGLGGEMLTRCTSPFTSANDKTDVRPYTGGLDVIKRLKPLAFRHKNDGSSAIGLNSEDVAEVDPSLVTRDEKLSVEKVDEDSLSILFINAFKEQQKQIDDLIQANKKSAEKLLVQERRIEELKKIACGREISTPLCEVRR